MTDLTNPLVYEINGHRDEEVKFFGVRAPGVEAGICRRCNRHGRLYSIYSPHSQKHGCDACHWFRWIPGNPTGFNEKAFD